MFEFRITRGDKSVGLHFTDAYYSLDSPRELHIVLSADEWDRVEREFENEQAWETGDTEAYVELSAS